MPERNMKRLNNHWQSKVTSSCKPIVEMLFLKPFKRLLSEKVALINPRLSH